MRRGWDSKTNEKLIQNFCIRIGRGAIWSVYKGGEVEWGVGLGEMCVIEYCIVWFAHCLVFILVFNTYSSNLGSTRFWVLIVYNMCPCFFFYFFYFFLFFILLIEVCLKCCMSFCVICAIALYCVALTVLYCPALHCSTLPRGLNTFSVNNNNNNNNNNNKERSLGIDVHQIHCSRHEGVQRSFIVAPLVLNLVTRWMCVVSK